MNFIAENGRQISEIDMIRLRISARNFNENYTVYSKDGYPMTGFITVKSKISDIINLTTPEWVKDEN